jgi:hypothetical protein
MMGPLDFTQAPQPWDAKARLRPVILRGAERRLGNLRRAVAEIERVAVTRFDVTNNSSRIRDVTITLPRVRFLER